jgi:2,4-dienoyl-CoA reductase-like NADH-dependent reductase (Old Yellow Enzyme family)
MIDSSGRRVNKRTDEWGGTFGQRMGEFGLELKAVRKGSR